MEQYEKKVLHNEQRVLVLFDVQNMYYSAKNLYNAKVNFQNILREVVANRKLVRAIAYTIQADMEDENKFHEALMFAGIEVRTKALQTFIGGAKKGDWDIGIAMDAVRMAPKVDTVILVSGDGDFKALCLYLQSHGCRAEIAAFWDTASKYLKDTADVFIDLSKDKRKFLMPLKPHHKKAPGKNHRPQGQDSSQQRESPEQKIEGGTNGN